MSKITDELRKYSKSSDGVLCSAHQAILAIADRIDEEHQKALDERKAKHGDMWLKGYEVCREELMEGHPVIAASLEEAGWIRLPKDADGVPIHIGDELDGYGYPKGGAYCKAIVNEVTILAGSKDSSYRSWLMWDASEVRHHHEPTVEDVLREFTDAIFEWAGKSGTVAEVGTWSDVAAEYAAKLQLKEDE